MAASEAVHASELTRVASKRYQCYCSNGPHSVFLRRPKKRRAHFTHSPGAIVRSDPDRELHDWTRDEIYRLINSRLRDAHPFLQVEWRCEHCRSLHRANLLDLIARCYRERFTDKQAMRPDLSLHGEADDVRTVIEVVNSNPPEDDKLVYYRMQMMTLIVIPAVKTRSDLFRAGVLRASVAKYSCRDFTC